MYKPYCGCLTAFYTYCQRMYYGGVDLQPPKLRRQQASSPTTTPPPALVSNDSSSSIGEDSYSTYSYSSEEEIDMRRFLRSYARRGAELGVG